MIWEKFGNNYCLKAGRVCTFWIMPQYTTGYKASIDLDGTRLYSKSCKTVEEGKEVCIKWLKSFVQ